MYERTRRVALLIDYDNLQICASRDTPGRDLQLEPVVRLAQQYGSLIVARAYAEWNLSTERLAVYKAGIEPAFAPVLRTEGDRGGKSLADTVMVTEAMDILWMQAPDVIVLATSDKDLIPLVRAAKQRGARVIVVGSDLTAVPLREMADEHVSYKQLITDFAARHTEFAPGRQPVGLPEPVRRAPVGRRERERPAQREEREPRVSTPASAPASALAPVAAITPPLPLGDDGLATRRRRRRRRRGDRPGEYDQAPYGSEGTAPWDSEDDGAPPEFAGGGPEQDPADLTRGFPAAMEAESPAQTDWTTVSGGPEIEQTSFNGTTDRSGLVGDETVEQADSPPDAKPPQRRPTRTRRPRQAVIETAETDPATVSATPGVDALGSAAGSPAGESDGSESPAEAGTPRPRARRVASASRGRSR